MRVLQIFNQYLNRGGEEASVNRIWENLSEFVELERCMFTSHTWVGDEAPPVWKQAISMAYNPQALQRLRKVHEEFQPDCWLVHNVFPVGSAGIYKLACDLGVPVVYYIHNFRPFSVNGYLWAGDRLMPQGLVRNFLPEILHKSWQESLIKTAWLALILKGMHTLRWFRCVHSWVAISHFMKDRFVEAGIPEEDIHVVPHFWNPQENPPAPGSGEDYFLFLGRLVTQKGTRPLIAAWDQLAREMGDATPCLKIGGQGPEEDFLRAACDRNPHIEFVGEVYGLEKIKLLRNCRAMIAPSLWWEPLGLVTYEAYDNCKPMLASSSGGMTESVVQGETGLLHKPGDVAGLVADVKTLLADRDLGQRMGEAGHRWLLANTSRDQWVQRLLKALNYAVEKPSTAA